jgi:hypothetical protein
MRQHMLIAHSLQTIQQKLLEYGIPKLAGKLRTPVTGLMLMFTCGRLRRLS